jgi:DNA mismatch endonuclease (patch repair protein)
MVDHLSRAARSDLMRRIKSAGSSPERLVLSITRRLIGYFRPHAKSLPGRPDVAIFSLQKAIFVHGCFWHQHRNCARSNIPKSNQKYWVPKLARNVQRDKENRRDLRRRGWEFLVVWECECRRPAILERKIKKFLGTQTSNIS